MRRQSARRDLASTTDHSGSFLRGSRAATALSVVLAALVSGPALAGGGDVSTDEIYSDGITLRTWDGLPLDIDGDGATDLAVAANRLGPAGRSRYYLGNGDGTFGTGIRLTVGQSSEIVAADIDGDTFIDLLQARRDDTTLLYLNDGAGAVQAPVAISTDAFRTLSIAVGDLDNDGDLDIVTGNGRPGGSGANQPQRNRFYLSALAGVTPTFVAADISTDEDDTRGIALADLDLDGDLDVIAGNDETTLGSNRVYLNQFVESGNLTVSFAAGVDFGPADDQTSAILVGDLNNDNAPDIVAVNNTEPGASPGINRFFLNQSTVGSLVLANAADVSPDTDKSDGGALVDFDNDGDLDLVVSNALPSAEGESARTRLYLNQFIENANGTVTFAAGVDVSPDEQLSRDLDAADINGDTFPDIVVGNQDQVPLVSGRDRRYLNNGPATLFANVVPVIDTQLNALETPEETDLAIVLADVTVTDGDNIFPDDFTLIVQSGTDYAVTGNTITPATDFTGELTVPVIVNDGTDDSAAFDLLVTVTGVNDAPIFISTPVLEATADTPYTYDIETVDPDSASLGITVLTLPAWLTLTDNMDGTATLTGTPAEGDIGPHDVSLQVSDGTASTTQDFAITVAGVNAAPAFDSTPLTDATEDAVYTYDVTASDPDGGPLTITAPTLPAWLTLTDYGDGTATLTGTPADGDVGDSDVVLRVSDGTDSADQTFTIAVAAAAPPPPPPPPPPSGGGGGGSTSLLSMLGLLAMAAFRRRRMVGRG